MNIKCTLNHQIILFSDVEKNVFIDSQRPGLHISTFFRQLTFDVLYVVEYVILLGFGLSAKVYEFTPEPNQPGPNSTFVAVIISFTLIALVLRILYYTLMHVWSNVIISGKKLIRKELEDDCPNEETRSDAIRNAFFQYVFVTRNTWICGALKNIQTTLLIMPKTVIARITGHGEDLDHEAKELLKHNPLTTVFEQNKKHKFRNLIISLMCLPMVLIIIVFNLLVITLLVLVLILTIPVALGIFFWNLFSNNGFKAVPKDDKETVDDFKILEIPPEIESG